MVDNGGFLFSSLFDGVCVLCINIKGQSLQQAVTQILARFGWLTCRDLDDYRTRIPTIFQVHPLMPLFFK